MIPAIITPRSTRIGGDDGKRLEPGSWWRLVDPEHEIAAKPVEDGMEIPAHGIVMLLAEIHVVDGEIHAVTLHGHPILRMGRIKMLRDEFLNAFSPCPEGEALRAAELAAAMGRIQAIGASMSDMPDDQRLLEAFPPKPRASKTDAEPGDPKDAAGEAAPARIALPAALLPSGDVVAAQGRIEHGIAVLEARSAWVKAKTEEMTHGMKVVQSYQEERVAQSLAGISEQRKMAEGLLRNVHTMRLFLGEGVEIATVLEGESAPAEEPLHLMQRMLYLDEEIFVSSVMDQGFHAGHMRNLSSLLAANRDLVERMLPHPRSVAIARIRRKSRQFDAPENLIEAFQMMEKDHQDKYVQILIRDGDNVRMVMADEETSRAQRLFPSRAEIDAIFTDRSRYDWEKRTYQSREITPFDIEYSDKRSEHDQRALFYKRFLIILWGLQEREKVFGPFIPQGANWLEETVHTRHFRFVHDEENVLSDDLKPVKDWLAEMNAWIRPGSRVLVQGDRLMTEDTAPTAYGKGDRLRSGDRVRERDAVNRHDEEIVGRRGGELVIQLQTSHRWSRGRDMKTPVTLRRPDGRMPPRGVLCLDRADAKTLRRYIHSRRERETYLDWLELFMQAVKIVEIREAEDRADLDRLLKARGDLATTLPEAMRMVREDRKGVRPEGEDARILKLAALIDRARAAPPERTGLQLRLRANGDLVRIEAPRGPLAAEAGMPLLEATVLKSWSGSDPKEGASRLIPVNHLPEIGETVIIGTLGPEDTAAARSSAVRGLRDPAAFEALASIVAPDVDRGVEAFLREIEAADAAKLEAMLEDVRSLNHEEGRGQVQIPSVVMPAGVALVANRDGRVCAWALRVSVDPVLLAFRAGRADLVEKMCGKLYAKPEKGMARLRERAERRTPITLERQRLTDETPLSAAKILEPGWTFESWDPVYTQTIDVSLEYRAQGPVQRVEIPRTILHAVAANDHLSRATSRVDLERALLAAKRGKLIAGPGVEALLEAILADDRPALCARPEAEPDDSAGQSL